MVELVPILYQDGRANKEDADCDNIHKNRCNQIQIQRPSQSSNIRFLQFGNSGMLLRGYDIHIDSHSSSHHLYIHVCIQYDINVEIY